jgi:uridine kinase
MDVLVIGIAGGTGSGKTTLTNNLKRHFGDQITVVYHDNYYKRHDEMTYDERCLLNYDIPEAFDTQMFVQHLKQLKSNLPIDCPVYDYTIHNRSDQVVRIEPQKVIIVEGILVLESRELCDLMDIKVFVDTDADTRILRRAMRDMKERARSIESITQQYLTTVKPMHEKYVEPSKKNADLIIPEGGENRVALDLLIRKIEDFIKG